MQGFISVVMIASVFIGALLCGLGGRKAVMVIPLVGVIAILSGKVILEGTTAQAASPPAMPSFLQSIAESFLPEMYIKRSIENVGTLESAVLDLGFFTDITTVQTTEGFYSVVGVVRAVGRLPVFVSGLNDDRLEDRLCIGLENPKCYRMTGHES